MPEIFSTTTGDGIISILKSQSGAWVAARTATSATANSSGVRDFNGTRAQNTSGRGAEIAQIGRCFFTFDTSGISVTPSSATLKIRGLFRNNADVIAVRSTHTTPTLANGDFDALHNSSTELGDTDGSGGGSLASVSGLTYLDIFKVALIEYDMDYLDVAPVGSAFRGAGMYFADNSGTSFDPKIDYVEGVAGYGHSVLGVASGNISKVKGVATANIGKVIGVD